MLWKVFWNSKKRPPKKLDICFNHRLFFITFFHEFSLFFKMFSKQYCFNTLFLFFLIPKTFSKQYCFERIYSKCAKFSFRDTIVFLNSEILLEFSWFWSNFQALGPILSRFMLILRWVYLFSANKKTKIYCQQAKIMILDKTYTFWMFFNKNLPIQRFLFKAETLKATFFFNDFLKKRKKQTDDSEPRQQFF